jgi:putative transposase
MLSDIEFSQLCVKLKLPQTTVAYINRVRRNPPSEGVQSIGNAVSGFYPSAKMQETKQFRNRTLVFPAVLMAEYNQRVLEYHDKPEALKLRWVSTSGRTTETTISPDFLVIEEDAIAYEEWLSEETLIKQSKRMPNRYQRTEDGGWCCPPGIEAAGKLGLEYRIRTERDINLIVTDNTLFLGSYLRPKKGWRTFPTTPNEWLKRLAVDKEQAAAAIDVVKQNEGISLEDLRKRLDAGVEKTIESIGKTADLLNSLIVAGSLYVNLEKERLAQPEHAHVFTSPAVAAAYVILPVRSNAWYPDMSIQAVTLDPGEALLVNDTPWTVISTDSHQTALLSEANKIWKVPNSVLDEMIKAGEVTAPKVTDAQSLRPAARERLDGAGPQDYKRATYRWKMIAHLIKPNQPVPLNLPPARTLRDWVKKYKDAERQYGLGYIGLLDNTKAKGRRTGRFTEDELQLAESYIVNEWETYTQPSIEMVYKLYVACCAEQGILKPVSYRKMCDMANKRPVHESRKARKGSKGAYPVEPQYYSLKFNTPRHGSAPMTVAHIDHTQVDARLRSSQNGKRMEKPWLTLLICAFSRRILALYMSFHAPSYISCMMVLRECMRRHGRLPDSIVCDKGREFQGEYFASMLAENGSTLFTCPSKPRYGSVIERLFGTANRQLFWNLKGNTRLMRNPRAVSKAANPKMHAVWTLPALYATTCEWAYKVYDTRIHKTLGESPRDAYYSGIDSSGRREGATRAYDEQFIWSTCPPTPKKTAIIQTSGVLVNNLYYWHDLMRSRVGEVVPVKFDPHEMGYVLAYIQKRWRKCEVQRREFVGQSSMVVKLTAQLLREENERRGLSKTITDKGLAEFFVQIRHNEALLAQQHEDREHELILDVIKGTRSYESLFPKPKVSRRVVALVGAGNGHSAEMRGSPFVTAPARRGRVDAAQPLMRIGGGSPTALIDDHDDGDDDYIEPIETRTKP